MGKIAFLFLVIVFSLRADLDMACLSCHKQQQIPSELIYKRYLMNYSTSKYIEEAMFSYLKKPSKESSIMPPQFFLKFPMKKASKLSDEDLRKEIKAYIKRFDIKKKLILNRF